MQNVKMLAKKILDTCDKKRAGKITQQEFIQGQLEFIIFSLIFIKIL